MWMHNITRTTTKLLHSHLCIQLYIRMWPLTHKGNTSCYWAKAPMKNINNIYLWYRSYIYRLLLASIILLEKYENFQRHREKEARAVSYSNALILIPNRKCGNSGTCNATHPICCSMIWVRSKVHTLNVFFPVRNWNRCGISTLIYNNTNNNNHNNNNVERSIFSM